MKVTKGYTKVTMSLDERIDIDKPLWDQSTYIGRLKHFAFLTDLRAVFASEKKLKEAKQLCDDYRMGKTPPGIQMSDIIRAKQLRDTAFRSDTGELIHPVGRLPCQLPVTVLLTSCMLGFQKSTAGMVFFQIVNQMHNAIINYTYKGTCGNESADAIRNAFICAILTSSLVTIGCRRLLRRKGPVFARTVPFCAVVAGHMTNLPIIRYKDITAGIPLFLKDQNYPFMKSKVAAIKGLTECLITRVLMCVPCLLVLPVMAERFGPACLSQRRPWLFNAVETSLCTIGCLFMIPCGFALYPEKNSMNPEWLRLNPKEFEEFEKCIKEHVDKVYYKKGL